MDYLDKTGLSHFWDNSKNYITKYVADSTESTRKSDLEDSVCADIIASRTGRVWKRKVWKYSVNSTSDTPALDTYADGVAVPYTDTVDGSDPYMDKYAVFKWMHCNYVRDDDSTARVTALEGTADYAETGAVDVGTLLPTFWWNYEDSGDYYTLTFSDSPSAGLKPWVMAVKTDGTVLPYFIVSSYASVTASDGKLRSQPGVPAYNQSYNSMVTAYQKKGTGYWGGGSNINTLCMIYLMVKYGTKNSQTKFFGQSGTSSTVSVAYAETGAKRVLVSALGTFRASQIIGVGTASVDWGTATSHDVIDRAEITSINTVTIDGTDYIALNLGNLSAGVDTTTAQFVKTFPAMSGVTNRVLGHYDGTPYSNTDGCMPFRIEGIEMMQGQYNIASDTVIDFLSNSWQVYVAPKGVTHVANAHTGYTLIGTTSDFVSDVYVGNDILDPITGGYYHSEKGTSSSTGVGDYHYNGGTSVTDGSLREWPSLSYLGGWSNVGFSYVYGGDGLSSAYWYSGSRD